MASELRLLLDGKQYDLMKYLEDEGEKTYPGIGERTYRVPPVSFHIEKKTEARNKADGYILGSPEETYLQKNLAEEAVCGAFEKLSDTLLNEGKGPLFIITNFEYDNYLNKIDVSRPTPQQCEELDDKNNDNKNDDDENDDKCKIKDDGDEATSLGVVPEATLDVVPGASLDVAPGASLDVVPEASLGVAPEASLDVVPEASLDVAPEGTTSGAGVDHNSNSEQQQQVREIEQQLPTKLVKEKDDTTAPPSSTSTPIPKSATSSGTKKVKKVGSVDTELKRPRDMTDRGEMDGLLLHRTAGVILLETKAVGHNFSGPTRPPEMDPLHNISIAVTKAADQLVRDRMVMMHVMGEIGLADEHMTSLIAMPNLTRKLLEQAYDEKGRQDLMDKYQLDLNTNFLCKEDLPGPDHNSTTNATNTGLYKWWHKVLLTNLKMKAGLDIGLMKQIAFRTVGLLSTVDVWSVKQPRFEVRNLHDATIATANCFTQLIISSQQAEVLKSEDRYVYIWGTSGSGKTLLLALKGRQWLRRHRSVVILNTRLGSEGRVVGREMLKAINNSPGLHMKAQCVDFDLRHDMTVLRKKLADCKLPRDKPVCFLFDEVTWKGQTVDLMATLRHDYPDGRIWCAGMLEEFCLPEFEKKHLEDVLRCPPWVQRVLRVIDNNRKRAMHYHTDNIKAGLATNGPKPYFVIHSHHGGDPNVETLDCQVCAKMVADYLNYNLHIKQHTTQQGKHKNVLPKDSNRSQPLTSHDSTRDDTGDKPATTRADIPTESGLPPLSPPPTRPPSASSSTTSPLSIAIPEHSETTTTTDENILEGKSQNKKRRPARSKKKKEENENTSPSPTTLLSPSSTSTLSTPEESSSLTPTSPSAPSSVSTAAVATAPHCDETPAQDIKDRTQGEEETMEEKAAANGEKCTEKKKKRPRGKKKGGTTAGLSNNDEKDEDGGDEMARDESPQLQSPPPPSPPSTTTTTTTTASLPSPSHQIHSKSKSESSQQNLQNIPEHEDPADDGKTPKNKKRNRPKKKTGSSSSPTTNPDTVEVAKTPCTDPENLESSLSSLKETESDTSNAQPTSMVTDDKSLESSNSKTNDENCPDVPNTDSQMKDNDADGDSTNICLDNDNNKNQQKKNKRGKNRNKKKNSTDENVDHTTDNNNDNSNTNSKPETLGGSGRGGKGRNRSRSNAGADGGVGDDGSASVEDLRYSDVVIPITMPREWHHLNDKRYYSLSKEALAQNMIFMGSSPFCTYLLENEVPLKVEMAMRLTIEGQEEPDQHLIMCPGGAVHGLEYKVVICLPTGCSTPETKDFNYGVLDGELGDRTPMHLTEFGKKLLEDQKDRARRNLGSITTDPKIFQADGPRRQRLGSSRGSCSIGAGDDNNIDIDLESLGSRARSREEVECDLSIDGIRIATHVEGDPENDVIYREPYDDINATRGVMDSDSDSKGGDVVVAAVRENYRVGVDDDGGGRDDGEKATMMMMRSTAEKSLQPLLSTPSSTLSSASFSSSTTGITVTPTTLPTLPIDGASSPAALTIQDVANAADLQTCGFCDTDYCVCEYFEPHELAALNRMRPWEKAYILMTASRCTASLIMVLP